MVKVSETIKFLGLKLDKGLNVAKFIIAKARNTHYDLEKIKRIRQYISETRLRCSYAQWHYHTQIMET